MNTLPRILPGYRDEVRKKIVTSAHSLFLRKGYHGTTMEEIADSLGVTKPALYQYFPGKEDLFAAVAEHSREEMAAILRRSYNKKDLRTGSAILFDSLVGYIPQFNGMYAELMLLAVHNTEIQKILARDRAEDLRVIEQFVAGQQENGLVSGRLNARTLAVACDALINGLLMDIMMGMDTEEARGIWLDAVTRLVRVE
ncbi:MAG: TetR/AcrR family transcriptional regulator [Methanoregula sp.]|uniref:TetR/AcrR family transcriptional regulator n=1 Tax=Methanoregula sp. TaxID=2052170 RepID=UPI003D0C4CF3